jgi:hypothetical protein
MLSILCPLLFACSMATLASETTIVIVPSMATAFVNGAISNSVAIRIDQDTGTIFVNDYNLFPGAANVPPADPDSAALSLFGRSPFVRQELEKGASPREALDAYQRLQQALIDSLHALEIAFASGSLSAEACRQQGAALTAQPPYSGICRGATFTDIFILDLYCSRLPLAVTRPTGTIDPKRDRDLRLQKCNAISSQITDFMQHKSVQPRVLVAGGGRLALYTGQSALDARAQIDAFLAGGQFKSGPLGIQQLKRHE